MAKGDPIGRDMLLTSLGFGLMLSLTPLTSLGQVSLTTPFDGAAAPDADYVIFVFNLLGFTFGCSAVVSLLGRRLPKRAWESQGFVLVSHVLVVLLFTINCLTPCEEKWLWAHAAASLLAGATCSLGVVIWGSWVSFRFEDKEGDLVLAAALFVSAAAKLLSFTPLYAGVVAVCATSLLLAVSSFSCLRVLGRLAAPPGYLHPGQRARVLPRVTKGVFLLAGFVPTCLLSLLEGAGLDYEVPAAAALLLLSAMLLSLNLVEGLKGRFTLGSYTRTASFLSVLGFLFFLVAGRELGYAAGLLMSFAWYAQITLLLGTIVALTSAERAPFHEIWSTYCLQCGLGVLAAFACVSVLRQLPFDFSASLSAIAVLFVVAVLCALPTSINDTREFFRGTFLDGETVEQRIARQEEYFCDRYSLSPREGEAVHLLARGLSYRMIAAEMGVSENTVKTYVKSVYAKCGVQSRGELVSLLNS